MTGFGGYIGNFEVEVSSFRSQASGPARPNPETQTFKIGAVVLATGFDLYAQDNLPEYGGGRYPDVIDGLQFETMLREGHIQRPSGAI